jgi:1,4-alpha-glucan branching enzyme
MNLIHDDEPNDKTEPITFHCLATRAATVSLIGDFNNWSATKHLMQHQADGSWRLEVPLTRGYHYYQFLVDGEPVLDPEAMCTVRKERNSKVSLIALS